MPFPRIRQGDTINVTSREQGVLKSFASRANFEP
jgi:hypothetical protein